MKYWLIIMLFVVTASGATVYRTVDKDGNVVYTDVDSENAQVVPIDIAPSYTPPVIHLVDEEEKKTSEVPKYKVSITSPVQDESFQNPESISVAVTISPALSTERQDRLLFKLDGKATGKAQQSNTVSLSDLERGSHIITVSVVNRSGKVLKRGKSILFHVHRRSVAN